jgi:hypothetical protein
MTEVKDGVIHIEREPDDYCEYCNKFEELRPYGKNGARICWDCGLEHSEETSKNMIRFLKGNTNEN